MEKQKNKHDDAYYIDAILKFGFTRAPNELPKTMWKHIKNVMLFLSKENTQIIYRPRKNYSPFAASSEKDTFSVPDMWNYYRSAIKDVLFFEKMLKDNEDFKKFVKYYDKYEDTPKYVIGNTIKKGNKTMYQIVANKDIPIIYKHIFCKLVKKGECGGYIESGKNLSQEGYCWIDENSYIYNDAQVSGNATLIHSVLTNNASVSDDAMLWFSKMFDDTKMDKNAKIEQTSLYGNCYLTDSIIVVEANIYDDVELYGNSSVVHSTLKEYLRIEDSQIAYQELKGNQKIKGVELV